MLHATLLTVIYNFTKINKPNIKLNNSININLTNPINNEVKNAIFEEIEILEKIEKNKPTIPNKASKTASISKPSPKPIITAKPKIKKKEIIKKENLLNYNKLEESVSQISEENKKQLTKIETSSDQKIFEDYKKLEESVSQISEENKKQLTKIETSSDQKIFEDYKEELKYIIQKKASQNYPKTSLRKKEQGAVELLFTIDLNGNIKNVKIGNKTTAPRRLINSSKKTLMSITPYKKNDILKKINTFSIIIVYILE